MIRTSSQGEQQYIDDYDDDDDDDMLGKAVPVLNYISTTT
jgi:hypothetical protein